MRRVQSGRPGGLLSAIHDSLASQLHILSSAATTIFFCVFTTTTTCDAAFCSRIVIIIFGRLDSAAASLLDVCLSHADFMLVMSHARTGGRYLCWTRKYFDGSIARLNLSSGNLASTLCLALMRAACCLGCCLDYRSYCLSGLWQLVAVLA